MKVRGTRSCFDRLALEVNTVSPEKNLMPVIRLSYFQKVMETYERRIQQYMTPLKTLLSYSSLRK